MIGSKPLLTEGALIYKPEYASKAIRCKARFTVFSANQHLVVI